MPPTTVKVDPDQAMDFSVAEETPHKVAYKFWFRPPGGDWSAFGPEVTDDDRSDHWIVLPPLAAGSVFAYWLGVGGHASSPWRVRLTLAQQGGAGASWVETGTTTDEGNGTGVDATPVRQVTLS